jgi:hypothetical protein
MHIESIEYSGRWEREKGRRKETDTESQTESHVSDSVLVGVLLN